MPPIGTMTIDIPGFGPVTLIYQQDGLVVGISSTNPIFNLIVGPYFTLNIGFALAEIQATVTDVLMILGIMPPAGSTSAVSNVVTSSNAVLIPAAKVSSRRNRGKATTPTAG